MVELREKISIFKDSKLVGEEETEAPDAERGKIAARLVELGKKNTLTTSETQEAVKLLIKSVVR